MNKKNARKVRGNVIVIINEDVAAIEVRRRNGTAIPFLIDREDVEKVRPYTWCYHMGYCCSSRQLPLSWLLLGKPPKKHVYHPRNGDIRDYRKSNLELISLSLSNSLKSGRPNRTTGLRGISKYKDGPFVTPVGPNKRKAFKTVDEAVAARKLYQESG